MDYCTVFTSKLNIFCSFGPDSSSDSKTPSTSSSSGNNVLQKKSILIGQRTGIGVSKMLSQFKSYSQFKKSPVLSQRPSAFCSPDDEDEEEESDYSKFLEMKGNSRTIPFGLSWNSSLNRTFHLVFCIQWHHCPVSGSFYHLFP